MRRKEITMLMIPYPTKVKVITSEYGPRGTGFHNGLDFATPVHTDIIIPFDGVLAYKNYDHDGYGHYMVIDYPMLGISMLYAHLDNSPEYSVGHRFDAGTILVRMTGNSGHSTGPHLHWEVRMRLYGIGYFSSDAYIKGRKLDSVNPRLFLVDFDKSIEKIHSECMDSPDGWDLLSEAMEVIATEEVFSLGVLHTVLKQSNWYKDYIKKVYFHGTV